MNRRRFDAAYKMYRTIFFACCTLFPIIALVTGVGQLLAPRDSNLARAFVLAMPLVIGLLFVMLGIYLVFVGAALFFARRFQRLVSAWFGLVSGTLLGLFFLVIAYTAIRMCFRIPE